VAAAFGGGAPPRSMTEPFLTSTFLKNSLKEFAMSIDHGTQDEMLAESGERN